jgi:hypothetical protein
VVTSIETACPGPIRPPEVRSAQTRTPRTPDRFELDGPEVLTQRDFLGSGQLRSVMTVLVSM